jgi:hypothetical protein
VESNLSRLPCSIYNRFLIHSNTKRLCLACCWYSSSRLQQGLEVSFSHKRFLCIVLALIAIILIDTSFVKIYEIIDKDFAPNQIKILLFSGEALSCLLLQVLLLKQVWNSFKTNQLHSRLNVRKSLISHAVL